MDASRMCQDLQRNIGALFKCSQQGDYQRIRTPYLYPDGDNIDVFCKVQGDTVMVSDLAETTGWLRMQTAALRRSPKQTRLIEDACVTHGIEFYRGTLHHPVARSLAERANHGPERTRDPVGHGRDSRKPHPSHTP